MRQMTMDELSLPIKGAMRDGPFGSNLKSSDFVEEGIKVIRTQNIKKTGYVDQNVAYISPEKAEELSRYEFKPGDLVIAKLGVDPGVAAVIPESCGSGIIPADVVRFRGDPNIIDHHYLARFLNSPKAKGQIKRLSRGSTRTRVNLTALRGIVVDVPSLEEQRQISKIFDKVDSIESGVVEVFEAKTSIIRSVFINMFGDMLTNTKEWPLFQLGAVCETQLGKAISREAKLCNSPSKYIRNANVRWRSVDLHDLKEMDFKDSEKEKLRLKNGDILTTEGGDVGRSAIWNREDTGIFFQNSIHRIRVNRKMLTPEYLVEYFAIMSERGGLIKETTQVTIAHLTGKKLRRLPVPIPPLELQQKFSIILEAIENIPHANLEVAKNLVNSTKQELLTC